MDKYLKAERLIKVAEQIEMHPDHFNMHEWYQLGSHDRVEELAGPCPGVGHAEFTQWVDKKDIAERQVFREQEINACGTTACVAGWAARLYPAEWDETTTDIEDAGKQILGLTDHEADRLFYSTLWEKDAILAGKGIRVVADAVIKDEDPIAALDAYNGELGYVYKHYGWVSIEDED